MFNSYGGECYRLTDLFKKRVATDFKKVIVQPQEDKVSRSNQTENKK